MKEMKLDHNLDEFATWIEAYVDRLSPAERNRFLKRIAQAARKANQARLARQVSPEGIPWARRADKLIKRPMMRKIKLSRHLTIRNKADSLKIGWTGRTGTIARVHHFGLRAPVNNRRMTVYPERPLIGLSEEDIANIRDEILKHINPT